MIKIKGISKNYKKAKILKNISYEFVKGIYLIGGPSGSGKTTLLNILGGKDKNYIGKKLVKGEILYFKDKDNLPGDLKVSEVFYLFEIANDMKIKHYFEIKSLLNKKIKKLSLGELQLIVLNMVLNSKCENILLDEPFSALSPNNLKKAISLLEEHSKCRTIIIATHTKEYFTEVNSLNLDNYKQEKYIKEIDNSCDSANKPYKLSYSLLYLKKTLIKKVLFTITLIITIMNYVYIKRYSSSLTNDYLRYFEIKEGDVIEKVNDIRSFNEDVFFEIVKKIAKYAEDYNANYYSSELYNKNLSVDNYYIDNAFVLSSFKYLERALENDEIVLGFNYNDFCKINSLYTCDENHLKVLLVNKKLNDFNFKVKDIFDNYETVVLNNKRFNKIYENNEMEEYYIDVRKENVEIMFEQILKDDFLLSFKFIKIGENEGYVRYKIELDKNKYFYKVEYSDYIVCLEEGYNCLNYINHFKSLVSIEEFKNIEQLDLEIVQEELDLNEIIVSTKLSEEIKKKRGDYVIFYFNYDGSIYPTTLKIKDIVDDDKYLIYQNSSWNYSFFKEILNFKKEDLLIEKILVREPVKKGDIISENLYEKVLKEIRDLLQDTSKIMKIINVSLNGGSVFVLIMVELFYNKFKKEYFEYLKILGVDKK